MITTRRLSRSLLLTLAAALAAACGGGAEEARSPSSSAEAKAGPTTGATETMPASAASEKESERPKETVAAQRAKPLKERWLGTWTMGLTGEARKAAEEAARKKAGKDEAMYAALMKQAEEDAAKVTREYTGDLEAAYENGKLVYKIRYSVVKEEGDTLTMRRTGTDEVSKKEAQGEYQILFKNDDTIEIRDPDVKDPKKATVLILKRSMVQAKSLPPGAAK
jgi:hypothetical protein